MATDHIHPDSVWLFELARLYTKGLSSRRTVIQLPGPSTIRMETALTVVPQLLEERVIVTADELDPTTVTPPVPAAIY